MAFVMALSYLSLIQGQESDAKPIKETVDGELFVKKLLNQEKINENPPFFMFTAPYKICEGGCEELDETNFAMIFPVMVGNHGRKPFKDFYPHENKEMFKSKPTRSRFVTCPPKKRTANLGTKSTGYPGYNITSRTDAPTQSTGYPDFLPSSPHQLTRSTNNFMTSASITANTAVFDIDPDYKKLKNKKTYIGSSLSTRFLLKLGFGKTWDRNGHPKEISGRYARKIQQPRRMNTWTAFSMEVTKPLHVRWTQTIPRPTKSQNSVYLKKTKQKELSPFGFMPVLPITPKKYHETR